MTAITEAAVEAAAKAIEAAKLPDGTNLSAWVSSPNRKDCDNLGIRWPGFPYDRDISIREEQIEMFVHIWARAALAAAAPHLAAPDWRPIESDPPPKDGTVFDVWLGDINASDAEFYCTPGTLRSPSWHWKDGKFRPFLYAWIMPTFVRPTHWMPLPAPPAAPKPPGSAT